ncbi:MAG: phosphodiester glycosidase family protein [Anaerolineales bacterium]
MLSRSRIRMIVLVCLAGLLVAVGRAAASPFAWTRVSRGIDYQSFILPGPVRAYVARMDRAEADLILESGLAQGSVLAGTETVSQIAERYDGAVNAWGGSWGATNKVWVAINGSYFDLENGEPFGGVIQGGQYALLYKDLQGVSGLVFKQDRSVFVGGCVSHPEERQRLTNFFTDEWVAIDDVNNLSGNDSLVLYTDEFNGFSPGGANQVEVVIELSRPSGILPPPAHAPGVVLEVRQGLGPTPIMFNQVVLSMRGPESVKIADMFHPGDKVGVSFELTNYALDCRTPDPNSWTKAYSGVGGNLLFLADGEVLESDNQGANLRNPRTAICNLDGGGSSTMWVNGIVQNHPSDGHERGVANALMMVAVQPTQRSLLLAPGTKVRAIEPANIYIGPGDNFRAIASVDVDTHGVVLLQPAGLNGLFARDAYWWKVDFGGTVGWVDESQLERIPTIQPLESLQMLLDQLRTGE